MAYDKDLFLASLATAFAGTILFFVLVIAIRAYFFHFYLKIIVGKSTDLECSTMLPNILVLLTTRFDCILLIYLNKIKFALLDEFIFGGAY